MSDLTKHLFQSAGRHFVTLSCLQYVPSDPKERLLVFSGFLVDIDGLWFYVTAGHILNSIRASLDSGATFDVWRLGDHTAGNKFNGVGIPFSFEIEHWLVIEDAENGLDYAAVPLRTLDSASLAAGGSVPLGKEAWGDYLTEHDFWALIGIPRETVAYDNKTIISARVVMVPVTPADEPPMAGRKAQNQFYARLADDSASVVRDVEGMSGGPIFGLKKIDGIWKYVVIGVQSGWYPMSRTIAACPFSSFGLALEEVITDARTLQEALVSAPGASKSVPT